MIVPTYETTAKEQEIIINNQRKEIERLEKVINDLSVSKDAFLYTYKDIEAKDKEIDELKERLSIYESDTDTVVMTKEKWEETKQEIERLHSIIKEVRNCNLKDISILKTRRDMSNEEMIMRLKATNLILDKVGDDKDEN